MKPKPNTINNILRIKPIKLMILTLKLLWSSISYVKEQIFFGRKIRKIEIEKDPVFILGFPRSGTTLLFRLLAADPQFAYIKVFDLIFPYASRTFTKMVKPLLQRFFNKFNIKEKIVTNKAFDLDMPEEEDTYLASHGSKYSVAWSFIFPVSSSRLYRRHIEFNEPGSKDKWMKRYTYLLKKILYKRRKKQLLLKNPSSTARINTLLEMFPNAKFIYIYRNPIYVYSSSCRVFEKAEQHVSVQRFGKQDTEDAIFDFYELTMDHYQRGSKNIPKKNLIEIRYEDFINKKYETVKHIYKKLNIPGFNLAEKSIVELVDKENSFKPTTHKFPEEKYLQLEKKFHKYIKLLGYNRKP
ncbi:MAG: sulfotransferase [Leptospirales bacterium]